MFTKSIVSVLSVLTLLSCVELGAFAPQKLQGLQANADSHSKYEEVYYRDRPTYLQRHPYVKKAVAGAAIGAGAGLIFSHGTRGVAKGAIIGAGAGLGYEYLRRKGVFR